MKTTVTSISEMEELKDRIRRHEGVRFKPYQDSEGIWTGGVGRNLEAVPFSEDEVELMFQNDFERAWMGASSLPHWDKLNSVRRGVIVEMVFQMGRSGVSKFKNFFAAIGRNAWSDAHNEMIYKNPEINGKPSTWASQTPARAKELARTFLNG